MLKRLLFDSNLFCMGKLKSWKSLLFLIDICIDWKVRDDCKSNDPDPIDQLIWDQEYEQIFSIFRIYRLGKS